MWLRNPSGHYPPTWWLTHLPGLLLVLNAVVALTAIPAMSAPDTVRAAITEADTAYLLRLDTYLRLTPVSLVPEVQRAHSAMVRSLELGQMTDAVGYGLQALEVKELPPRTRSRLLIQNAILNLEAGNQVMAEEMLLEAISLTEADRGHLHPDLILPVTLHGLLLFQLEEFDAAKDRLHLGQHLVHLEKGVYSLQQLPILEALTSSYLATQGLFSHEAEVVQRLMLSIHERHFGRESPDLVPALLELAQWYNSTLCFEKAQRSQQRAIRILEAAFGPDNLSLVDPLVDFTRTRVTLRAVGQVGFLAMEGSARRLLPDTTTNDFIFKAPKNPQDCRHQLANRSSFTLRPALRAMRRAVALVRSSDEAELTDLVSVLTATGDLLITSSDPAGDRYYREAWEQLTAANHIQLRDSYFDRPKRVFPEHVDGMQAASADDQPVSGPYTLVSLDVNERGQVRNLKIVETSLSRENQSALRKVISSFRYRPRRVNGEAVTSTGLLIRHRYSQELTPTDLATMEEAGNN